MPFWLPPSPALLSLLLIPAAISRAEIIGLNFQDDFGDGNGGAEVTDTAFEVPASNWFNLPRVFNSIGAQFATSTTVTLPGGGDLLIEWSAQNTYSLFADIPTAAGEPPGADQVTYGYLDDSDTGYTVKLSGLRNSATDYKITLIASSDSASGFTDANLVYDTGTDLLVYGAPDPGLTAPALGGGAYAYTPASLQVSAATANNSVTITGVPRDGSNRSTLAAILIDYTPGTSNVPIIQTQPAAPAGTLFTGDTVTLTTKAHGSPTLSYQWRKGTTPLDGATGASLTLSPAAPSDSGDYDVVITNSAGSATSTPVTLSITPLIQPSFTVTPKSQQPYSGYPVTFTSGAVGGNLSYSWKKGDTVIPDVTGPVLSLASIAPDDSATYTVTATNSIGSVSSSADLSVVTPTPGTYEAAQAAQKPLLWFRYNETVPLPLVTGAAANIGSTGAAANGVAKRYAAFGAPGVLAGDASTAAGITSNNQFIDIPHNPQLNPAVFTAELWVKPPPVNRGLIAPLVNRGGDASNGFLFFGWNTVTKWQFRCYDGLTRTQVNSDVDIVAGQWTHLVGVYDGTTARLYVNGVEQGTGTQGTYTPNGSIPIRLAGWPNDNGDLGGANFAGGALDEVAIYDIALSPAQILSHYQNGTDAARTTPYPALVQSSAPVGYWRMDDPAPAAPPVPVNSGTAGALFNGSYGGDIAPGLPGPLPPDDAGFPADNKAAGMSNGYTVVPPLNITTNTLTVTCWLKRAEVFTNDDLGWPAWLGAGGGFHIDGTSGRPYGELRYHWDGGQWGWGSGLQVPADIWTFCALVLQPDSATVYLGDGDTLRQSSVSATHTPHLLSEILAFGGNQAGRVSRNFIGQIDESAFYDRALSESEIASLFLTGAGAPFSLNVSNGGVLDDTKPAGDPVPALNYGAAWVASSSDGTTTRDGVLEFSASASTQMVIPPTPAFDSPTGTLMFWMKTGFNEGNGSEAAILFDHRTGSGAILGVSDAGGLFFQTVPGSANTFSDNSYLPDFGWHHVALTWNQDAAGSVAMYVDGALSQENTNAGAWSWPAGQQIEFGRSHDPYWLKFNGQLDEIRLYNTVLSAAEIASAAGSDALPAPESLTARYTFGTPGSGLTLDWPYGILESSTLQPGAGWLPVPGAVSPLPVLPAEPARFYRARLP